MPVNPIEKMLPRHFAIMDLTLAGMSGVDIAETLGVTRQTIYNVQNSPIFQDELERRRGKVEKETNSALANTPARAKAVLDENATRAAERLANLVDSMDDSVALRASSTILDKVLGKDEDRIRPITINVEQMAILQSALEESQAMRKDAS